MSQKSNDTSAMKRTKSLTRNNNNETMRSASSVCSSSSRSGRGSGSDRSITDGDSGSFVIHLPTTTRDSGEPSTSVLKDTERIFALIEDERHLSAYNLYMDVSGRLQNSRKVVSPARKNGRFRFMKSAAAPPADTWNLECQESREALESKKHIIEKLKKRAQIFQKARKKIQEKDEWILSQTLFGITTHYRKESDDSLSVKMEGELRGVPLFEQVAVLKEVDLHCKWAPFCASSMTLKDLDKLDTVGWFVVGLPSFGLARDACFRAIGCDNMVEDGTFILVGQGIQDRPADIPYDDPYFVEGLEGIDIPDSPTRLGSGRMTIKTFSAVIEILSPTAVKTKIVANIQPRLAVIPQSLIDFIMRKLCGVLLNKLQNAAKSVHKDPVRNPHAQRMRREEAFYIGWLKPKFESYCQMLNWEMPSIPAFELTDQQLEHEQIDSYVGEEESIAHTFKSEDARSNHDEWSATSSITMDSHSPKKGIVKYLREIDERIEAKKKAKQLAGRKRAANRLKAKPFSRDEQARLKELKQLKARRWRDQHDGSTQQPPGAGAGANSDETSGAIWNFHSHGKQTRLIVTSSLASFLLIVLQFGNMIESAFSAKDHSWLMTVLLDICTLSYLSVCAAVHFVFCDVALVYCYEALDLGTKSGQRSKEFYDANLKNFVAIFSVSLVGISAGKAFFDVGLRWTVWYSILASRGISSTLSKVLELLQHFTFLYYPVSAIVVLCGMSSKYLFAIFQCVWAIVELIGWLLSAIFISSNNIGATIGAILGHAKSRLNDKLLGASTAWEDYVDDIRRLHDAKKAVAAFSWRDDAIATSRSLLTYTAVFLFSVLVLFNLSSKNRKFTLQRELSQLTHGQPRSEIKTLEDSFASAMSLSKDLDGDLADVPEDSELPEKKTLSKASTSLAPPPPTQPHKRFRRFRRRKRGELDTIKPLHAPSESAKSNGSGVQPVGTLR